MNIDIRGFDDVLLLGDHATRSPAPRSPRHAALLYLAGVSPLRPRPCRARPSQRLDLFVLSKGAQAPFEPQHSPLPGTPITALASAFNYRFQVESTRTYANKDESKVIAKEQVSRLCLICVSRVNSCLLFLYRKTFS
ncbi:MAG: hypothetical protein LBQ32_01600 [Burkholderiaceae bacterium]|jgi:hypothetical protein|nr:hypothetical protein [Burkholderiaceae bacterium]